MPKKGSRTQSRTLSQEKESGSICGVCCQAVTPGKDEALFCEGACKRLMHRFCASVTVEQYQELTAKEAEFLCPTCCRAKQQLEIDNLSGEVTALKLELAQLKEAVTILSQKQKQAETTVEDTWTTVNHEGGRDRRHTYASRAAQKAGNAKKHGRNGAGAMSLSTPHELSTGIVPTSSLKGVQAAQHEIEKEKVFGARRIWGTMKSTTPGAISSALKKLTTVGDQVSIKRKHRQLASGRTRWWFVLKGEEQVLTQLEDEWECVCLQLSWKLEPCFKPKVVKVDTHTEITIDPAEPVPGPIVSKPVISTCISDSIVSAATDVQTPANSPTTSHNSSIHSTASGSDVSDNQ